jgi:2-C-methyl-D-erythritol 4-phosphate cytidylyltransferase/2-C-methyl-D-erythritol 2,4-cyclodiphosphate synthase
MYRNRKVIALIMAAGNGSRFGAESPKQFLDIGGESMMLRAARAFDECGYVDEIRAVASPERQSDTDAVLGVLGKYRGSSKGGGTRQESVRFGLRAAAEALGRKEADADRAAVLIHDAARPFVTGDVIERVLAGVDATGAAIACVPVTDTIYVAGGNPAPGANPMPDGAPAPDANPMPDGTPAPDANPAPDAPLILMDSPDRDLLWSVQTPQGFDLDMILRAHEAAAADGFEATDDGAVARVYGYAAGRDPDERRGANVLIVEGDYANRKITIRGDIDTSPATSSGGLPDDRVGIGFDVHAFAPEEERALVLGGVTIPYERGLEGHSDADVLTHSLMDAMLGALALGDIGCYFPETDDRYRGISSMKLLEEVREMIGRKGYIVYNADMTIVAERPRMAGHVDGMRDSIAAALGVSRDRIGIKATTTERLGFTGREEGIGAQAIVRLVELAEGE